VQRYIPVCSLHHHHAAVDSEECIVLMKTLYFTEHMYVRRQQLTVSMLFKICSNSSLYDGSPRSRKETLKSTLQNCAERPIGEGVMDEQSNDSMSKRVLDLLETG